MSHLAQTLGQMRGRRDHAVGACQRLGAAIQILDGIDAAEQHIGMQPGAQHVAGRQSVGLDVGPGPASRTRHRRAARSAMRHHAGKVCPCRIGPFGDDAAAGPAYAREDRGQGFEFRIGRMTLRQGAENHGTPRAIQQGSRQAAMDIRNDPRAHTGRHRHVRRFGGGAHHRRQGAHQVRFREPVGGHREQIFERTRIQEPHLGATLYDRLAHAVCQQRHFVAQVRADHE